ncbi:hypothetical protein CTAYLR_006421 [Chrysophaeum taylorii]|uniref:Importin N-terminal domain-containing protein n=1 Tax=Chrysophaeum taylorii TaxID=2483200 RepID=A0AAD7UAE3_9STRA|nr:hypothetical protein CTAYLR_006421 [Chrysophaeum taylorii]
MATLEQLLSADNEERRGAEAALQAYLRDAPLAAVEMLVRELRSGGTAPLRWLAAVLLRKAVVTKPEIWWLLSDEQRAAALGEVIEELRTTRDVGLRRRCADAVAAAAQAGLDREDAFGANAVRWCLDNARTLCGLEVLERICAEASPLALAHGDAIAATLAAVLMEDAAANNVPEEEVKVGAARAAIAWCLEVETDRQVAIGSRLAELVVECLGGMSYSPSNDDHVAFVLRAVCDLADDGSTTLFARRAIVEPRAFSFARFAAGIAALPETRVSEGCRCAALDAVASCVSVSSFFSQGEALLLEISRVAFRALVDFATTIDRADWCVSGRDYFFARMLEVEEEEEDGSSMRRSLVVSFDEGVPAAALRALERVVSSTLDADGARLSASLTPWLAPLLAGRGRPEARRAALAALVVVSATGVPDAIVARVAEIAVSDPFFAVRAAAFECLEAIVEEGEEDEEEEDDDEDWSFFWTGLALDKNDIASEFSDESSPGDKEVRAKIVCAAAVRALGERGPGVEQTYAARSAARALGVAANQVGSNPSAVIPALARAIVAARKDFFEDADRVVASALLAAEAAIALAGVRRAENEVVVPLAAGLVDAGLAALASATRGGNAAEEKVAGAALAVAAAVEAGLRLLAPRCDHDPRVVAAFERVATFALDRRTIDVAGVVERGCLRHLPRAALATDDWTVARNAIALACAVAERGSRSTTEACRALYDILRTTRGVVSALTAFDDLAMRLAATLGDLARRSTSTAVVVFSAATVQRLFEDRVAAAAAHLILPDSPRRLVAATLPLFGDALRHPRAPASCSGVEFSTIDALAAVAECLAECLAAAPDPYPTTGILVAVLDAAADLATAGDDGHLFERLATVLDLALERAVSAARADFFRDKAYPLLASWLSAENTHKIHPRFRVFLVASCAAFFEYFPDRAPAADLVLRSVRAPAPALRRAAVARVAAVADPNSLVRAVDALVDLADEADDPDLRDAAVAGLVSINARLPGGWSAPDHASLASKILARLPLRRAADLALPHGGLRDRRRRCGLLAGPAPPHC